MSTAYLTNTVTTGVLAEIVSFDNVYVALNATVGSTGNSAIHGAGNYNSLTILGNLFGTGAAISLGDSATSFGNRVFVGAEGSVIGSGGQSSGTPTDSIGVKIVGVESDIVNHGLIHGDDFALYLDSFQSVSATSHIVNTGEIDSLQIAIYNDAAEQTLVTRNRGTIDGELYAYIGSFGSDRIYNRGLIIGDIDLSGGDDIYNAHKAGEVDGTVYGGSGNDILIGGTDDDWLAGSYDKDTLTGGAGNDVFYFMSSLQGNSYADVITDFDVVHDTIALNHNIFSALVGKDLTPTVLSRGHAAIGVDALSGRTSPYLIYDSDRGTLYYDADGAGQNPRIAFATVDPGLKLTAHDFILV